VRQIYQFVEIFYHASDARKKNIDFLGNTSVIHLPRGSNSRAPSPLKKNAGKG